MNPLFDLFKDKLKGKGIPALIDRGNGDTFISAANIYTSVIDRARDLKKLDFKQGDILVDSPCGREGIINFLVCQYFDATYFPMAKEEIEAFKESVKREGPKVDLAKRVFTLEGYQGISNFDFLEKEKDYALLLQTSGTYQKKTVGLTAEGLVFQLKGHVEILKEYPHEHKLSLLPKFHCFGLILDILVGALDGKYITLYENGKISPKTIREVLAADEIDFITGVPKHLEVFIRMSEDPKNKDLKELFKKITFYAGGAPVNEGLERRAKEVFKDLIIGYGLTEAGPGIMMNHKVLPGVEVKYMDDHLYFRSPSTGDYRDKITKEGWVKTNDIFSPDTPRRPLGRSDDFAKSDSGLLYHSTQIEETLDKRFGVNAYILNNNQGKHVFIEEGGQTHEASQFLKKAFPEILNIQVLPKKDVLPLLQKTRGKSAKDVLKKKYLAS